VLQLSQFVVTHETHNKTLSVLLLYALFTRNDLITSLNKPCTMPLGWRQSDIAARYAQRRNPNNARISLHSMVWHLIASIYALYQTSVPDKQLFVAASNLQERVLGPKPSGPISYKHTANYQQLLHSVHEPGRLLRQLQYVNVLRIPTFSSKCCLCHFSSRFTWSSLVPAGQFWANLSSTVSQQYSNISQAVM
jgi:hypothetical protein